MIDKKLHVRPQGDRELVMQRAFDAPRDLVFQAYTKPELLKRWLGVFGGWELATCEIDLRVGGTYRWVWRNPDRKQDMDVRGVYREIAAPDRRAPTGRSGGVDRAVSPALGRAVLRAGQGRRRIETEGEAGWKQESKVSPP